MLRLATLFDEDRILEMCEKFFEASPYSHLPVYEEKVREMIRQFTSKENEDYIVILWEREGEVLGVLAGHVSEMPLFQTRVAAEDIWWVEPQARGTGAADQMLGAFEYWANLRGASMVQMASLDDRTGKLLSRYYKQRGYKRSEFTYVKGI